MIGSQNTLKWRGAWKHEQLALVWKEQARKKGEGKKKQASGRSEENLTVTGKGLPPGKDKSIIKLKIEKKIYTFRKALKCPERYDNSACT